MFYWSFLNICGSNYILSLYLYNMKLRLFKNNCLTRQLNNLFLFLDIWLKNLFRLNNFAYNLYNFFTLDSLNINFMDWLLIEYWLWSNYLNWTLYLDRNLNSLLNWYNIFNMNNSIDNSINIDLYRVLLYNSNYFFYNNLWIILWLYFNNFSNLLIFYFLYYL
jgi:hypothetical protein